MIDPLRLTVLNGATTLRRLIGLTLFLIASAAVRTALKLLPHDHPGRIYGLGRWSNGHSRIRTAMSGQATTSYIAGRRQPFAIHFWRLAYASSSPTSLGSKAR